MDGWCLNARGSRGCARTHVRMKDRSMRRHQTVFCVLAFVSALTGIVVGQDSLYLVGTLVGESYAKRITGVKGVGDVNGDGYDDFMVSIGQNSVRLYFGTPKLDLVPDVSFAYPGKETLTSFGGCAEIGDVNDDGYDDFLLSGSYADGGFGKGKVFLYLGGSQIDTIPTKEFSEPWIQDWFGHTIEGVGDINNDGYDDFIIGSPYNWSDERGRVYLYLGGDSISDSRSMTFATGNVGDRFGRSVANIGDLNGDGFDDVAISALIQNGDSGKVYVFFGGNLLDTIPDTILTSGHSDYDFGRIIENVGDCNRDTFTEFCIAGGRNVYLHENKDTMLTINCEVLGIGGYVNLESSCDINNDGYSDFVVGNTNHRNSSGVMVGGAYIYLGKNTIDTVFRFILEGENKWDEYSRIMTTADVNHDGFHELFVMAPNFPDYNNPLGKVYIYSYKQITGGVAHGESVPKQFDLCQNYPNPFNARTNIVYAVGSSQSISLKVYDVLGREIQSLSNGSQEPGAHTVEFDAIGLSSGTYIYRFQTKDCILQKKMVLLR